MTGHSSPPYLHKHVALAQQLALETAGVGRYRLSAVLFSRGTIIAAKGNSKKTHPLQLKYSPYPYLHAESHCIIHHGLDNCGDLHLLVVRILKDGRLTMAKPCKYCEALARTVGISQIYYTNWNGDIECL